MNARQQRAFSATWIVIVLFLGPLYHLWSTR